MRILLVLLSLLTLQTQIVSAQGDDANMSNRKKIQLADALMEAGSYYNALDLYQEAYEDKGTPALEWKIADAMFKSRDYINAEMWYKKVWENTPGSYPEAQYYYALSMKMNGKYESAKTEFDGFRRKTKMKGAESVLLKKMARNEAKGCDLAKLIMEEALEMEINPMDRNVNAPYTDFAPVPVGDDELMYASLRADSIVTMGANKKTTYRAQMYETKRSGQAWSKGKIVEAPFNESDDHIGNGSFTADGDRFYFTECKPDDAMNMICEIYVTTYDGSDWGKASKVKGVNESQSTSTHPTVATYKGKTLLYFTSNREGTVGGMDLWYAELEKDGKGAKTPRNLGRKINTVGDEITPFWDSNEEVLYFSSNGQINIGGHDVYKVSGTMRSWKTPLNAGYPINSNVDDMYFTLRPDGKSGFMVSNREGAIHLKNAYCCDDIFEFEYIFPPEFAIMGAVYNKEDRTPIEGANIMLLRSSGPKVDSTVSELSDPYDFFLGTDFDDFRLEALKQGYTGAEATTSTMGLENSDTLYVDLYLEPIDTTRYITIKNIYYELDKATLRPESKFGLDSLYDILVNSPAIKIELSSHTDSRGGNDYNIDLSQRRAESCVRYLVDAKGIDPERLEARGYGETRLLNECADGVRCSEEEHQLNRRTEFRIVGEIPGTIVSYDAAEIDAIRALEREKGSLDSRIEELMDREELEELEQFNEQLESDQSSVEEKADEVEEAVEEVQEVVEEVVSSASELDASLTKKGSMFTGQAIINETTQAEYMIDPKVPVVMISDEFYSQISGTVSTSDFTNSKPTTLADGTTLPGDIFTMSSLQLGDKVLTNVETKINTRMTRALVVGRPVLEKNGCKIDVKKMRLNCK